MPISNKFLRPSDSNEYQANQSDIIFGLWTPYGLISPLAIGINPDGHILITYAQQPGTTFKEAQKKKIAYVEARGVKIDVMPLPVNESASNE